MIDTSAEIDEQIRTLYASRTPGERVEMASSMFDTAVELVRAGIRHQNPSITEANLRWEVFARFYSDCYTTDEMDKIKARIF